jgi:hypothetical protein
VAYHRIALLVLGAALVGPVRLAAQAPASPEAAVNAFMQAVADSNMTRMMQLWGTEKGSAMKTKQPPDYQKRVYVMYSYLRGASHRISGMQPDTSDAKRRSMLVEFKRNDCTSQARVRVAKSKDEGWLVNWIDLAAVGTPGRQCGDGQQSAPQPAPAQPAPSGE